MAYSAVQVIGIPGNISESEMHIYLDDAGELLIKV